MAAMQTDSIVPFQSIVLQQKTPQQIDTVVPMETDTAPAQVATIPISPNLQDIFAEYRLPTVVSPITIPCSDSVLDRGCALSLF
jgi:hypothetical protein